MTLAEIVEAVDSIRRAKADDEIAHSMEDKLHVEFIRYVAATAHTELATKAAEVLKTSTINFARWCA